ncbi:MAG: DNA primase [Caldimicrobium sp.]
MFEKNLFEEIKNRFEIVSFISQFVNLKKVGRNYVGHCPFHAEKTPSFTVSPEKQIFKCFGCGAAGDLVTFYMKFKGLEFKDALYELAEKAGVKIDKSYFIEKKREKEEVELNFKVAKIYQNFLWNHPSGEPARRYLKERGLSEETAKAFYLGYAPPEGRVLASLLRAQKIDLDFACMAGLLKREKDGAYLDLFRDRLLFPIFNEKGECVGFGGRAINAEVEPKYLNTPESSVYKKSEILYGLFQSKDYIKKEGLGIIIEGYFDFLSLWERGIRNIVATCGTALTAKHIQKLKLFAEELVLFFDGDKAGRLATVKAISIIAKEGMLPRIISLSEDLDPDSFVQKSTLKVEELREVLLKEKLIDTFTFLKEFYAEELKRNPQQVLKAYFEIFKGISEPILLNKISREIAFLFNIPETEVLLQLKKEATISISSIPSKERESEFHERMKIIAQYVVNYPEEISLLEEKDFMELLSEEPKSVYHDFLIEFIKRRPMKEDLFFVFPEEHYQEILSDLLFAPPFEDKNLVLQEIKSFIKKELKRRELRKICENLRALEKMGKKEDIENFLFRLKERLKDEIDCKI